MLILDGRKYFRVFQVGAFSTHKDPDGIINEDFLQQVAANYDPKARHEAVFWAKHPSFFDTEEPKTGGYIEDVIALGKSLYVCFSEVLPWMKQMFADKIFKRVSVEFRNMDFGDGNKIPYLRAMCPTNIPAAYGLDPLDPANFTYGNETDSIIAIPNEDFKDDFSQIFQNPKSKMEKLISIAMAVGVDNPSNFTDETKLVAEINSKLTDLKSSAQNFTQVKQELETIKKEKVTSLIERGKKEGKIMPAEEQHFTDLANVNFTLAESTIEKLPVKPEFKPDTSLNTDMNPRPTDANKFFKDDGTKLTYRDILEKQSLAANFTDDELDKLRKESGTFPG